MEYPNKTIKQHVSGHYQDPARVSVSLDFQFFSSNIERNISLQKCLQKRPFNDYNDNKLMK